MTHEPFKTQSARVPCPKCGANTTPNVRVRTNNTDGEHLRLTCPVCDGSRTMACADAPPPAPERPEPKFKIGDVVLWKPHGQQGNNVTTITGMEWITDVIESVGPYWRYDVNPAGPAPYGVPEHLLTAAPESSIPIGGWFDPGDGTAQQRVEGGGDPDKVWFKRAPSVSARWERADRCSPLTEREAMERLYPAGTLFTVMEGGEYEVLGWRDDAVFPVRLRRNSRAGFDDWYMLDKLRRATVLRPPLPAPWRPLDDPALAKLDPKTRIVVLYDLGQRVEMAAGVILRQPQSPDRVGWCLLDDVAPIPAHLRSTP